MNIFYINDDPTVAAQEHIDTHVVKMILESSQLLCTAHRVLDGEKREYLVDGKKKTSFVLSDQTKENQLYKITHINHPCSIWCRQSINNYIWLYKLFISLCDEYRFRYEKIHKCDLLFRDMLKSPPENIPTTPRTPHAQAMPDTYRSSDATVAYRNYYIGEKSRFAKWTKRVPPAWFTVR